MSEADDLYELGVTRYLDKTDFQISQWLTDEELSKYNTLTGDTTSLEFNEAVKLSDIKLAGE